MLVSLAFAVPAVLVLLAVEAMARRGAAAAATSSTRIVQASRLIGIFLLAGAISREEHGCRVAGDAAASLGWMALFGFGGMVAIEIAQRLGLRALRGLHEAVQADNLAAATTVAAHTVAIGILVANVAVGTSFADFGIAAAAFVVGQVSLLGLVWLFRCLTAYDDRAQILGGNVAAALSHGGLTIALALVIAYATDGDYEGPWPAVRDYGLALAEALVVYPLRQFVVQCLILRGRPTLFGGELDRAIGQRADVGAGALEGATYLAVALLVRSLA